MKIGIDGSQDDVYRFAHTNEHWTPERTGLYIRVHNNTRVLFTGQKAEQ